MNRTCETCLHAEFTVDETGPALECRRYPPQGAEATLELIAAPLDSPELQALHDDLQAEQEELDEALPYPRFPLVNETDWCGEHKAPSLMSRIWEALP